MQIDFTFSNENDGGDKLTQLAVVADLAVPANWKVVRLFGRQMLVDEEGREWIPMVRFQRGVFGKDERPPFDVMTTESTFGRTLAVQEVVVR